MYQHILLPTDGSKISAKAVKQGLELAKAIGAKVMAFHVMPEYQAVLDETFAVTTVLSFKKQFDDEAQKRAKKILTAVKTDATALKVPCECVSVVGAAPYDAIIRQAKKAKCDLIMMASHGRKGLSGLLLGSETTKVLTHSTIPVLVVR